MQWPTLSDSWAQSSPPPRPGPLLGHTYEHFRPIPLTSRELGRDSHRLLCDQLIAHQFPDLPAPAGTGALTSITGSTPPPVCHRAGPRGQPLLKLGTRGCSRSTKGTPDVPVPSTNISVQVLKHDPILSYPETEFQP